jgi:HEPN domain-containing protein
MNERELTRAQVLLLKAAEDEQVIGATGIADSVRGFHAQQAVEKLLKALLAQLDIPVDRTHRLERLVTVLLASGETLPETTLPLSELNDFAVFYRYDLIFEYAVPELEDVLATVRQIREFVQGRIAALSGNTLPPPLQ